MYRLDVEGYQLAVQQWRVEGARGNLLMVHGYYDHVGLYGSLIDFALQQRLNVLAFDLPGHGLSSGEQASIDDFDTYRKVFVQLFEHGQQQLPELPWIVVGQSTGGATLATWLLHDRPQANSCPVKDVWLLAPLLRPRGWSTGRWLHTVAHPFLKRLKRHFSLNGNNPEFSRFLATMDPLQARYLSVRWVTALKRWIGWIERQPPMAFPVLLVQGSADETVDWQHNLPCYQSLFRDLEVMMLEGGHHHLVNEEPVKRQRLYQHLAKRLTTILAPASSEK
nr:alpha/beta hydrolase [Oceanobacter mangrovi]